MTATTTTTITTTDDLITTMRGLVESATGSLVEFAQLTPALYAETPWTDETVYDANRGSNRAMTLAEYMRDTFGIGASKDGYVAMPTVALDALVEAFKAAGVKPALSEMVAMSGTSKATVARANDRAGVTDPKRAAAISAGVDAGKPEPTSEPVAGVSAETSESPAFDLTALLSAMDDDELRDVCDAVGFDRLVKVLASISPEGHVLASLR